VSDNLSVSISADTSKARAEIDLLNAKIRSLRKEVRSASDEAQKSGTITPRLAQARASLDVAERQLAAYNRTGRETTRTNIAMSASFDGLVRQVGNLARATGLAIPGLKAMRAGFLALVGVEILRGLQSVTESITQIVDLAKQTGGTTEGIQVLTKAIVETGGHAEDATAIYQKMGQIWQGVQKQALETGNTLGKGAQVLRGGVKDATNEITSFGNSLVTVLRPGQAGGTDFSSIFTALKIDPKAIKSFEDLDIKIKRAIVSLHDSGQTIKANAVLVEFFGKTWAEVGDGLRETVKQFDAVKGRTRLISPEDKARNEAYQKSLADLSDAFSSFLRNGLMPILPHVTRFMELVTPIAGRLAIVATTIIGAAGAWRLLVMVGLQLWPVITGIGSAFAALLPWINSLLAIGRALLPVFAGLSTAVSWPVILGRAIVALVANVIAFREKIGKLYDYLRATFGSTVGTVAQAFQDAWNAARFIRFDFKVTIGGETKADRSHLWDKQTGRYRLDQKNGVVLMNLASKQGTVYVDGQEVGRSGRSQSD
jgi:hypothetical protein